MLRFFAPRLIFSLKNEVKSDTTELENEMVDEKCLADVTNLFGHLNGFKNKIKSSLQKKYFCKEYFIEMKKFEEVIYFI